MSTTVLSQYQLTILVEAIRNAPNIYEAERTAQKLLEKHAVFVSIDPPTITEPEDGSYYRGWDNEDPTYVERKSAQDPEPAPPTYNSTFWYGDDSSSSSEVLYDSFSDSEETMQFQDWKILL